MLHEYAVEPRTIAADWHSCRYLSEMFGFDRGRLLALYPKKWLKLAIEAASDLPDVQKKRVIEKLRRLRQDCSIRSGREYDPELPDWLTNAIAQHAINPFHAIISVENAEGREFVLRANDLDETHRLFAAGHDCKVQKDAESLATAMSMMLKTAQHKVLFVDPYYDPFNQKYQDTLRSCLGLVQSAQRVTTCEIHHWNHNKCFSAEAIEREARTKFRNVIPVEMKLTVYRWQVKEDGENFMLATC